MKKICKIPLILEKSCSTIRSSKCGWGRVEASMKNVNKASFNEAKSWERRPRLQQHQCWPSLAFSSRLSFFLLLYNLQVLSACFTLFLPPPPSPSGRLDLTVTLIIIIQFSKSTREKKNFSFPFRNFFQSSLSSSLEVWQPSESIIESGGGGGWARQKELDKVALKWEW